MTTDREAPSELEVMEVTLHVPVATLEGFGAGVLEALLAAHNVRIIGVRDPNWRKEGG